METTDKVIFDSVNKALSQFDNDGKQIFYHLLEESYGLKPTEISNNFELFHQALKDYYGNRHFKIQTLMIRTMQENNRSGIYDKNAWRSAFLLVASVFGRETEEHINQVRDFSNLKKFNEELKEKVKI